MVPILSWAHQDCVCPACFHNSRKREWDPSLTSRPKPFASLVCRVKNNPHSYRHRVSAWLNWCVTSAHLGMILSYSFSFTTRAWAQIQEKPISAWDPGSLSGMELPSKAISVTHEISAFSLLPEGENTFERPFFMGFEFNVGYHLHTNLLLPIPLYIHGISFKWCGSHKALNGFWFNFHNFSLHKGNLVGTLFCFSQHPETSCLRSHRYLYNKNCSKYLLKYCNFCEPARA